MSRTSRARNRRRVASRAERSRLGRCGCGTLAGQPQRAPGPDVPRRAGRRLRASRCSQECSSRGQLRFWAWRSPARVGGAAAASARARARPAPGRRPGRRAQGGAERLDLLALELARRGEGNLAQAASWRAHGVAPLPTRPTGSPSASASSYRRRTARVRRPGLPSVDVAVGRVARRPRSFAPASCSHASRRWAPARLPRGRRRSRNAGLLPDTSSGWSSSSTPRRASRGRAARRGAAGSLQEPQPPDQGSAADARRARRSGGFVLFSDVAYELLPLESPGRALAPLRRFFAPDSRGARWVEARRFRRTRGYVPSAAAPDLRRALEALSRSSSGTPPRAAPSCS